MAVINKYEKCIGLTLYKFGNRRAELWFCPAWYSIIEHCHKNEDIELMYLFGSTTFYRRSLNNVWFVESLKVGWRTWLRKFSVKHYHSHWFKVGHWPLVFINFQTFLPGRTPKSAAKDFHITTMENLVCQEPLEH